MLTIVVNIIAFYFGAVVLESTHSLLGVLVFVGTALPGTILSTLFEVSVRSVFSSNRQIRTMGLSHDV